MSIERQERINGLFCDAIERPAHERASFVASATDNSEVRDEVLRMLSKEEQLDGFMGTLPLFKEAQAAPQVRSCLFADGQLVAGRYHINRLIKAGGMGEVYEAFDSKLNLRIALKTILCGIAENNAVIDRFRREVTLARTVTHANVCRVFDFGEHTNADGAGAVCFFTMEYLSGETLRERLQRCGPMSPQQALPLIRQMANALSAAHAVGVVHRDFKPGNVMLVPTPDGAERAVVSDFGIARSTAVHPNDRTLTESGQLLGTPEYMSPEQWAGRHTGPEADIYALGVVIHEMTSPQRPLLTRRGLGRSATDSWKRVVDHCLARNPEDRPASAVDVVKALQASPSRTLPRWLTWTFSGAILVAVALAAVFLRFPFRKEPSVTVARVDRIAVLPPRVDNANLISFADGLTDAITSRLAQYARSDGSMAVLPASEMRRGKVDAPSIARAKFGARYAVELSMQSQGDACSQPAAQGAGACRLRLIMTVIDTGNMQQRQSAFIDGVTGNALALQDVAAARIATMLNADVQPKSPGELMQVNPLDPGAYEFYLQAKGYLKRNDRLEDINAAIEVAREALQRDPKFAPARTALAEAYWQKYRKTTDSQWKDLALRECKEALELGPQLAETHTMMGAVLAGIGEPRQAGEEFRLALQIDPRSFDAHLGLARAHIELNQYPAAEARILEAIKLQRQDWRGYRELGVLYYNQSEFRKAIEQFEHVVRLVPDNAAAYSNLGTCFARIQDYKKSEELLRKALQINPNLAGALTNLAKLLSDQGRNAEAVPHWKRAAELDPNNYRVWGNLGSVYRKLGLEADSRLSYERALRILNRLLAVNPIDGDRLSNRAHVLSALGRKRAALADLEKAGGLYGNNKEMMVRDATTFVELDRIGRARELLKKALDLGYPRDEAMRNDQLRELLQTAK